ncbi:MAG: hypothetical protein EOM28_04845 [Clostridia bacterium]|nr:hypothetical protein [Anaerotignum sp.]NCC15661.1 hypothetical protein [Clostridia bacterium]
MLSEYIGIIGAVAGSVSTLLATEGIRHLGSIKVFPSEVRIKYNMNSNFKNSIYEDVKQPFRLGYDLDVYNCCNMPQILHDFTLSFYKGTTLVLEDHPKSDKKLYSVNSKGIISITQVYDMDDFDNLLVGTTKIVLKYKTSKRRSRKFVLYEGQPLYPDTGKKV